jgi:hypothetical protein
MTSLWQANRSLASAARWSVAPLAPARSAALELAALIGLGVLAAIATTVVPGGWRIPGHAILRGTLPLVLGISLVPRRSAGAVMSLAAAGAFAAMRLGGAALPPVPAWTGLLCLGPAIDLALAGAKPGWLLYLRFALAGVLANLAAFGVRMVDGPISGATTIAANAPARTWAPGSGMGGGGGMGMGGGTGRGRAAMNAAQTTVEQFWGTALASFVLCGAVAGLIAAVLWFRASPRYDGPTAP